MSFPCDTLGVLQIQFVKFRYHTFFYQKTHQFGEYIIYFFETKDNKVLNQFDYIFLNIKQQY